MILNDNQYAAVWDRVYKQLSFKPTVDTQVTPFVIKEPHIVFEIDGSYDRINPLAIFDAFKNCLAPGEQMYALDWHHTCYLFDPRKAEDIASPFIEDPCRLGGGYFEYFPPFYPDGDYYFFIDEQFRFGYLGHPWRKEVWIFGESLIAEFDEIYEQFCWRIKR